MAAKPIETMSFEELLEHRRRVDERLDEFDAPSDSLPKFTNPSPPSPVRTPHPPEVEMGVGPLTWHSIFVQVWDRSYWLVGLLLLQSVSSFILESYSSLIETHLVVTFFLTMLVGAGGNAGNQSAVLVIRGLATGKVSTKNHRHIVWAQVVVGLVIAVVLSCFGFARVLLFGGTCISAFAISISLFLIVVLSMFLGTVIPMALDWVGIDALHAGPSIQVVMDILGVLLTCIICSAILTAPAKDTIPSTDLRQLTTSVEPFNSTQGRFSPPNATMTAQNISLPLNRALGPLLHRTAKEKMRERLKHVEEKVSNVATKWAHMGKNPQIMHHAARSHVQHIHS